MKENMDLIVSNLNNKIYKITKPNECFICGCKMDSPCNSHVVPQFILKSFAEEGQLYYGQTLFKHSDILKCKKGINNIFTFHLICKKCDNLYFNTYEKPEIILNFDSYDRNVKNRILSEIAIKALLANYSVKNYISGMKLLTYGFLGGATELDKVDYINKIKYIKKCKNSNAEVINIIYNKLLDYEVKLACQCAIAIVRDLEGNVCFDVHDYSKANLANYLYLNIFPYKGRTRIILFNFKYDYIDNNTKIIEQFNSLNEEDKLKFIFVTLTMYSEQFILAPSLNEIMKQDKKLLNMFTKTDNNNIDDRVFKEFKNFRKYENYLSAKYKKN